MPPKSKSLVDDLLALKGKADAKHAKDFDDILSGIQELQAKNAELVEENKKTAPKQLKRVFKYAVRHR